MVTAAAAGTIRIGDLGVHRLGFGAMRVCGADVWGPPADPAQAHRVLRRALELGINFFDTSDAYGPHVNETQIAEALFPYPAGFVIATKGGLLRPNRYAWNPDGRPGHLRSALEGSLTRLRLDCIDLYQLHAPDPHVPFAESVGALADMQRAGKIRHVGLSNVSVKQLEEACGIVPIVSVQNEYNLDNRLSEDVLFACERMGIAFLPWFPLGAGRSLASVSVGKMAVRHGATPAQVLLAWLLARSPVMLPIPGTGSIAHLEENVGAVGVKLSAEDVAALGRSGGRIPKP